MERRVIWPALILCLGACAPGQLRVEPTLAEDADEIAFVRASKNLTAHARIGPYRAQITRHAAENETALVYELIDPHSRAWTTTCRIEWLSPEETSSSQRVVRGATCNIVPRGAKEATAAMKVEACETPDAKLVLCGELSAGGETAELEPQTAPSENPDRRLHGYHVRESSGVTAAIETLEAGKIWIHRGLPADRRPTMVSALYGLFLLVKGAT